MDREATSTYVDVHLLPLNLQSHTFEPYDTTINVSFRYEMYDTTFSLAFWLRSPVDHCTKTRIQEISFFFPQGSVRVSAVTVGLGTADAQFAYLSL